MAKRTVNTENVLATAKQFNQASADFNTSLQKLVNIINTYMSENVNEAAQSVQDEWQNANSKMKEVAAYLEKFGQGLNSQANSLDQAFQGLKWK